MYSLTLFDDRLNEVLESFEEALDFNTLQYSLEALEQFGFEDLDSIQTAVGRAIRVCKGLGIEPRKHFRYYYSVDLQSREACRQWRVSKLGFYLVLCNGEPVNPYVGSFQLYILRKLLNQLD